MGIDIDGVERSQYPEDTQHQHHSTTQCHEQNVVIDPIDLSTTYFWVETTLEEGSLYHFAKMKQSRRPRDTFGYIKANGKHISKKKKKVIVIEKV